MPLDSLSVTFAALADPTRRAMLARLSKGEASVGELARPFKLSLPAVSKHLKVLEKSGMISRGRRAQWRPCRFESKPMIEAVDWIETYRKQWEGRMDRLVAYVEDLQQKAKEDAHVRKQKKGIDTISIPELLVKRVIDAPRNLVFQAWLEPERLAAWWGPDGFSNPVCNLDPRPGGAIYVEMKGPDGSVYPMTGKYLEIDHPKRLVLSTSAINDEGEIILSNLATVVFEEEGGKTKLTLSVKVVFATLEAKMHLQGMEEGWSQSIDRLKAYAFQSGSVRAADSNGN